MKIIRLVKLSFKKDFLEQFLGELEKRKERIRNFEGCLFLEIWQDKKQPEIIFTHSHWTSETALDNYRKSAFFKETWAFTKSGFSKKPEAWSLESVYRLN
jgi:hypothetical protein